MQSMSVASSMSNPNAMNTNATDDGIKLEETKPVSGSTTFNQTPATVLWSMSANDDNDTENRSKQPLLMGPGKLIILNI